jgi:cation diffusion facilitator family transporter
LHTWEKILNSQKRKTTVAALSVVSNSTLVVLKLIIGVMIGSVSVISEAIHSGVDLLAAVIALVAVKTSGVPADKEHPFGHGKVENISGTVEALLIFLAAGWIIYEASYKLGLIYQGQNPESMEAGLGVAVMLLSAVLNIVVSHMLFKVGKATDSVALQADAWHLRTDVYTSAGVMVGLAVIALGRFIAPGTNLLWIDPVAAILVALLIVKAAYSLTKDSARDLLDTSLPQDEQQSIRDCIAGCSPHIMGFHNLRTRKSGSDRFVELHLIIRSGTTVDDSHEIADAVVNKIREDFPGTRVTVHVEPCNGDCTEKCLAGCLVGGSPDGTSADSEPK